MMIFLWKHGSKATIATGHQLKMQTGCHGRTDTYILKQKNINIYISYLFVVLQNSQIQQDLLVKLPISCCWRPYRRKPCYIRLFTGLTLMSICVQECPPDNSLKEMCEIAPYILKNQMFNAIFLLLRFWCKKNVKKNVFCY